MTAKLAICFSRGIRSIVGIEDFLGVDTVIKPTAQLDTDNACVVVWGRKENTQLALAYAKKHTLPVVYLEDGFIRSCSENPHSRLTYSLIADDKGVYYDSEISCELELLLNSEFAYFNSVCGVAELETAQACIELMVSHDITKYNFCRKYEPHVSLDERPVVLVVDQTVGDASVTLGGMDRAAFQRMLMCAIEENPDARVVVKTHPDVSAGIKSGYLVDLALSLGLDVLSDNVNPLSVIKTVDSVYTGTSQLGFESLMCGKKVTVFGRPFYAGWGLTDDRVDFPSRTATRSFRELFFAALMWYPKYRNPITGQIWSLPECLQHVLLQKNRFETNARQFYGIGITRWKRRYIENYLRSPDGTVTYTNRKHLIQTLADGQCDSIVTWGYRLANLASLVADTEAVEIYRVEDGFLRSSGLGSDYNPPASLVFDVEGMYFNPSTPSQLERMLNSGTCSTDDVSRAKRLINQILSARVSKYNLRGEDQNPRPADGDKPVLLVTGQVENDASISYGCTSVKTNTELLLSVRQANPDAWIVYKPHPDVIAGNRTGSVSDEVIRKTTDRVVVDMDIIRCIEAADEVHTMTSLAGFEALLRGKTVVTYGSPFYAGWGLTSDSVATPDRKRTRTLEELVYFCLIQYPVYMDVETAEFASPEDMVARIENDQGQGNGQSGWRSRQITKLANVYKGLSYAP